MVETLFIVACESRAIAEDQVESIHWSCQHSSHVLLVDLWDVLGPAGNHAGYSVVKKPDDFNSPSEGFLQLAVLHRAIDVGFPFSQVVLLRSDCLICGRGLDGWLRERRKANPRMGLLGVEDRHTYEDAFQQCSALFSEWGLRYQDWETAPRAIHEAAVMMTDSLAESMFATNLLRPAGCERWPLPFGPYLAWTAQMLGHQQVCCGHMDRPEPPLYVNTPRKFRELPPPQILRPDFLLYYSIRGVAAYSEEQLRMGYKRMRHGMGDNSNGK